MQKMRLNRLIVGYLNEAKLMQVATSNNNQPWVCTVYFGFDNKLNLFWISKPTRRHSEEIRNNDKAAGAIVLPHTPGDKVRGLQFVGRAFELTNLAQAAKGLFYVAKRIGLNKSRIKLILDNKDGHLCYKIVPSKFVLFDEFNFPDNPRQEYII